MFAEDTKDTAAADPTTGKFGLSERDKIPIQLFGTEAWRNLCPHYKANDPDTQWESN